MKNQKRDGTDGQNSGGRRASAAQLRITKGKFINGCGIPEVALNNLSTFQSRGLQSHYYYFIVNK